MIRNLQGDQFKTHKKGTYQFQPENDKHEPKCVNLWLNSTDKMSGTNSDATFKIALSTEFLSDRLKVTLKNFVPTYPTGTDDGIVDVNMVGIDNPYSYSSSNGNTHRTLGTFWIGEGKPREYPPVAFGTSNVMIASNLAYGNGTYINYQSTQATFGAGYKAFDKSYYSSNCANSATSTYSNQTGVYINPASNNTTMSGTTYYGEWLGLQLPYPITLMRYDYYPTSNNGSWVYGSATDFVMGGSTNGSTWTLLDQQSNIQWASSNAQSFSVSNTTQCKYFRILATRVGNSNINNFRNSFTVGELVLWGYSNPQVPLDGTTPSRVGQSNLNCEVITCDRTLFDRPVTIQLRSPIGLDLSTMCNWSAELAITEE